MSLLNRWNDIPHELCVDDLFADENSPAWYLDIPEQFDSFEDASNWVAEMEEREGVSRDHYYISNEYAGGNMGNAMSQGEIT